MQKSKLRIVLLIVILGSFHLKAQAQVPAGYGLVWADEFNDSRAADGKPALRPDKGDWWYETGGGGWGNNELQYYVPGITEFYNDSLAAISDGTLKIKAIKRKYYGMEYASVRMNTSNSWTYGYFETRAKLPGGKGVWPAFWMLPKNFQSWPLDGEIDIMEYVGYDPNVVHATIHTQAYNHVIGTQKTSTKTILNAETEFHVYGLEWTETRIRAYVDGELYFTFSNDGTGNKNTWPFNVPFYLKLNLAIGGNWGGVMGVDTQIFPSTYEVDYVRVYQKNTALSEVKEENLFDANFNNVSNLLRVSFKEQGVYHLFVTDMQGRALTDLSTTNTTSEIDCSSWAKGFYLLSANNGKRLSTQKFVKY
ncbi:family 16 glycosylhydrolase [uncultured Bacteroides sp.]|uniref:family 16 glycosylhydrolase n=1 Tax=uncultured Bacteroides sp. TaxID=162156 RepID=UPI002AAABBB5|nr:family 16 glycosylhydrolase [uncultured Bacteroides sp.]